MSKTFVCRDCGTDLHQDKFIRAICPACGGTDALPLNLYQDENGRQPAPSDHAPRKESMLSPQGEFVVAEVKNAKAWVCVDVSESGAGLMEVRE